MESNEELKRLLLETLQLARENNKMLKGIRRTAFIRGILGIVWMLIAIVGVTVFYLYFLQPFVDEALLLYKKAAEASGQAIDLSGIENLLHMVGGTSSSE